MKKRTKKTRKPKKESYIGKRMMFVQEWGAVPTATPIVIGLNHAQIMSRAKRMKFKKEYLEWLEKEKDGITEEIKSGVLGFCIMHDNRTFMWMQSCNDDDWTYWETLLHETSHLCDYVLRHRNMQNETEARAYTHEYLFRSIRRKVMGRDKLS